MIIRRPAIFALPLILVAALAVGCASGEDDGASGSGAATAQGQLFDAPISGVDFVSGGTRGTTDVNGYFTYEVGQFVSFWLGGMNLGTVLGAPIITPVELAGGAAVDESDACVTEIVQFFLTLDEDQDASNGIQVPQSAVDAAEFITDIPCVGNWLAQLAALTNNSMASVNDAQDHFGSSLLELRAGSYGGTFAGDDVGRWTMTVSDAGTLQGSGLSTAENCTFDFEGSLSTNGLVTFGSASTGALFGGQIDVGGSGSGTWTNAGFLDNGSWEGARDRNESIACQGCGACGMPPIGDGDAADVFQSLADGFTSLGAAACACLAEPFRSQCVDSIDPFEIDDLVPACFVVAHQALLDANESAGQDALDVWRCQVSQVNQSGLCITENACDPNVGEICDGIINADICPDPPSELSPFLAEECLEPLNGSTTLTVIGKP